MFFTHPDSSSAESSLSTRREGEEGESSIIKLSFKFIFMSCQLLN